MTTSRLARLNSARLIQWSIDLIRISLVFLRKLGMPSRHQRLVHRLKQICSKGRPRRRPFYFASARFAIKQLWVFLIVLAVHGSDRAWATPWEGPPGNMAGGLLSPMRPVSYIDGNYLGSFDPAPYTESRERLNF